MKTFRSRGTGAKRSMRNDTHLLAESSLLVLAAIVSAWSSVAVGGAPSADIGYSPPPPPAPMIESASDGGQELRTATPSRIGRVSLLAGEASWFAESASRQGWIRAQPNLPIIGSSSLSTASGARAEVRIGPTSVLLDGHSQADFLRLDDDRLTVRVVRGRVAVSIIGSIQSESFELVARTTGLVGSTAGSYVLGIDNAGRILAKVNEGQADLRLGEASLPMYGGQQATIDDSGPLSHDRSLLESDEFDRWVSERATHWNALATAQQAPLDMTGADLLESHGEWQPDPAYGTVWYPDGVDASWAPHRDGRWATLAPVGQVWVATVPWGFATSYYGHWHRIHDRWGWVPGRQGRRAGIAPPAASRRTAPGTAAAGSSAPGGTTGHFGPAFPADRPAPFSSIGVPGIEAAAASRPIASSAAASVGNSSADPPRAYPTPPRHYPTPPRLYPTPPRAWAQDTRRAIPTSK